MPAKTKRQARLMRIVYAARMGKIPLDKLKGSAKKLYDSKITNEELRDFMKTGIYKTALSPQLLDRAYRLSRQRFYKLRRLFSPDAYKRWRMFDQFTKFKMFRDMKLQGYRPYKGGVKKIYFRSKL